MREDCRLAENEVEEIKARNPIMPEKIEGDTEGQKVDIVKPNLAQAKYLQSKQTTPAESATQSVVDKKDLHTDQAAVISK